jgi:hypothetical protein
MHLRSFSRRLEKRGRLWREFVSGVWLAGHFTQVVWKGSKQVGCGVAACGDKTYWVCRYTPTGNWNTNQPTVLTANVGCSKLDQWGVVKKPPPGTADAIKRYYPKQ